jgi:hypothetical protein
MGKNYYNGYRPLEMMLQTDIFFNFIEAYYDVFKSQDRVTLKQAYELYKEFCSDSGIDRPLPQYKVREELRNYFDEFKDRGEVDGERVRSLYLGFNAEKFKMPKESDADQPAFSLVMDERQSLLDDYLADQPAQEANEDGTPAKKWRQVKTKLSDIDTSKLHFVKVPDKHIVIDFDLKNQKGDTSLERNLEAAQVEKRRSPPLRIQRKSSRTRPCIFRRYRDQGVYWGFIVTPTGNSLQFRTGSEDTQWASAQTEEGEDAQGQNYLN